VDLLGQKIMGERHRWMEMYSCERSVGEGEQCRWDGFISRRKDSNTNWNGSCSRTVTENPKVLPKKKGVKNLIAIFPKKGRALRVRSERTCCR